LIALQTETVALVAEDIFVLQNWLRQNSPFGFPYITDGIADIEVWEEGKPYLAVGYYRLWTLQKA